MQTEATEVFFSVTKLFQSKDSNLRRMVYLIIKEICPSADEVIIVTSSLMKDMNSKIDLYRSNAIRVLCNITDAGLLGQIERYLKQAVVDKNAVVSSAALVSGIHLLKVSFLNVIGYLDFEAFHRVVPVPQRAVDDVNFFRLFVPSDVSWFFLFLPLSDPPRPADQRRDRPPLE